jgi:hypothetical protein
MRWLLSSSAVLQHCCINARLCRLQVQVTISFRPGSVGTGLTMNVPSYAAAVQANTCGSGLNPLSCGWPTIILNSQSGMCEPTPRCALILPLALMPRIASITRTTIECHRFALCRFAIGRVHCIARQQPCIEHDLWHKLWFSKLAHQFVLELVRLPGDSMDPSATIVVKREIANRRQKKQLK